MNVDFVSLSVGIVIGGVLMAAYLYAMGNQLKWKR